VNFAHYQSMSVIARLCISGYRSLRDVRLELSAFAVVTGANGSGKSSLYRAGASRQTTSCCRSTVKLPPQPVVDEGGHRATIKLMERALFHPAPLMCAGC
jgi:recombinational DNA repair ATPase RecF